MHWNFTAHKTLHFKTPEKRSSLWNEFVQIFETQIQDFGANLLTTNWCYFCRRMQCILPKKVSVINTLFQDLSLFQKKYSIPNLLLWLLCMYFSLRVTTCMQEGKNTSNKNRCDIKYFTWKAQNMNKWSHEKMLNLMSWHKTLECSKTVSCFSLWNSMNPAWRHVMVWTNMFC